MHLMFDVEKGIACRAAIRKPSASCPEKDGAVLKPMFSA